MKTYIFVFFVFCTLNAQEYNSVSFSHEGKYKNGYKIKTNIPFTGSEMPTVSIKGHAYGAGEIIDLTLAWTVFNNEFYKRTTLTNSGSAKPIITLSNEGGKVVIHLKFKTNFYYRFNVKTFSKRHNKTKEPVSYFTNWTVVNESVAGNNQFIVQCKSPKMENINIQSDADYSFIQIGKDINDRIYSDNTDNSDYGGGIWFRVHDPSLSGNKYQDVMMLTETGKVGIGIKNPRERLDLGKSTGAGNGFSSGDYFRINEREGVNNASMFLFNAKIDKEDNAAFKPIYSGKRASGMVMSMAGGGVSDLDFYGMKWSTDSSSKKLSDFTHVMSLSTDGTIVSKTINKMITS